MARNHGFLKEISWGFFFGHSSYKAEPSEKISAWHDFFPGLGVILASTTVLIVNNSGNKRLTQLFRTNISHSKNSPKHTTKQKIDYF